VSALARADQLRLDLRGEWPFVPCGLIHKRDSPLALLPRVGRIAAFQWFTLRPGPRGRAFRRLTGTGIATSRAPWTARELAMWERDQSRQGYCLEDGRLDPQLDWS